jgi:hypothetical protein
LTFCIQFFKQGANIAFQCVLTSPIERKIVLASDVCSRPPIIIRFHDLHAGDIRGVVGEITSYHKKDYFFPFFLVHAGFASFGLSLAFPFCLLFDGSSHQSFIGFLWSQNKKICHFIKLSFFSFPFLSFPLKCFSFVNVLVWFLGF